MHSLLPIDVRMTTADPNTSPPLRFKALRFRRSLAVGLVLMVVGCGTRDANFEQNRVYLKKQENTAQFELAETQVQNIADILVFLFGAPNEPRVPRLDDVDTASILHLDHLQVAAGRVSSDRAGQPRGLYREHCAHCHGLDGSGAGPTAVFLVPYPRDFRRGIFKFKSTSGTLTPPTGEDLTRIIRNGNPDTAMPSFQLLDDDEIEPLVHYVRYLSIRGEVERALIFESIDQLDDEYDLLVDMSLEERNPEKFEQQLQLVRSIAADVVQRWIDAPAKLTPVDPKPEPWELAASIHRGRELFIGDVANCSKCHGENGLGDGQTDDYDDWTKEILDPQNPDSAAKYMRIGALKPRRILPRNFHRGIYRGGSRPEDVYLRIHNGIAGTPMPAAPLKPDGADADDRRLGSDDIWHLVDYVLSLSRETDDS
jgi:mono/diheme cytochrome c family protein